jgi:Domain of unknown function (DUF5664)
MKKFTFYVITTTNPPINNFFEVIGVDYDKALKQIHDYILKKNIAGDRMCEYEYECVHICDTEEEIPCILEMNLNKDQVKYFNESYTRINMESPSEIVCDVNSKEKGSGARYNDGKPDFSLIPLATLEDEARVWQYGKVKYSAWNWTKGMKWSIPFSSLMRHMSEWQSGEEYDKESGLPHLAHAMCNLRMLTLYAKNYVDGDDRPKEELK